MTADRRTLRLGIDLDGVVADFNRGWMARYNAEFDAALQPDFVRGWDDLHPHTHFRDARSFWRWASGDEGPSIFRDLPPYPDALGNLDALHARGHRIVILTHKPDWAVHDTMAWLAEHRIPTREVHFPRDKSAIPCDVYLDDANHNLEAIRRARPRSAVCRFVRAWNEPLTSVADIHDWAGFVELVDRHASREAS